MSGDAPPADLSGSLVFGEVALGAVPHLDAGGVSVRHHLQTFRDVALLRCYIGARDQEIVRHAVDSHAEIRGEAKPIAVGAVGHRAVGRDQHPGARLFALQRPRVRALVERRIQAGDPFGVEEGDVVDIAHRKWLRLHIRRAIRPISPTSSRNAASGANPAICTSCRCGLRASHATRLAAVAGRRGGTAPGW